MAKLDLADPEHRAIDRPSYSSLKYLLKSCRKYLHQKEEPFLGNDATNLGTAVHYYLQGEQEKVSFEPDLTGLKTKAGTIAKEPRMTEEGKRILAEFKESIPQGNILVPYESRKVVESLYKNFNEHPDLVKLMSYVTAIEASHLGTISGVTLKGKFDMEGFDESCNRYFIIDFKTTGKDADYHSFKSTVRSSHYDLQAALYCELLFPEIGYNISYEDVDYYIVALETQFPYDIFPYYLSLETLYAGREKLMIALNRYILLKEGKLTKHNGIQEL